MLERCHSEVVVKAREEIESLKKVIADLEVEVKERDAQSEQL